MEALRDGDIEALVNSGELDRLRNACQWSYRKLQPFRQKRLTVISQFVGPNYGDNGPAAKVPVNFVSLMLRLYLRQLAAKNPKVLVTSDVRDLQPHTGTLEAVMNRLVRRISLVDTLRRWAFDGLTSLGIVKVGLAVNENARDWRAVAGEPFVDNVDLEDWNHDMAAKHWHAVTYMGDRTRLPFEAVKSATHLYRPEALKDLQPTPRLAYNEGGDEKIGNLTAGTDSEPDTFYDTVDLWDYYLPTRNVIVSIQDRGNEWGPLLRAFRYQGPTGGLYRRLAFQEVSGNTMPLPPVANLIDLHLCENALFRKLIDQAESKKTVLGVQATAKDDADRVMQAADGDVIKLTNPQGMQAFTAGGIDEQTLMFAIMLKDMFSYFAGNLDVLGGLGAQTDTVGQERLLAQASSRMVDELQETFISAVREVVRDLAWYRWHDPLAEDVVVQSVPGPLGLSFTSKFGGNARSGSYENFAFEIEPYSMGALTPAMRLQALTQVFQQFIAPMLPLMQQQGMGVNVEKLLRYVAKYSGVSELADILSYTEPLLAQGGEGAARPAQTTRTYERVNRPGRSARGAEQTMLQLLAGGKPQGSERGAMARIAG